MSRPRVVPPARPAEVSAQLSIQDCADLTEEIQQNLLRVADVVGLRVDASPHSEREGELGLELVRDQLEHWAARLDHVTRALYRLAKEEDTQ